MPPISPEILQITFYSPLRHRNSGHKKLTQQREAKSETLTFNRIESREKMSGKGVKKAVDAAKTIDWEGMAKMIVSDEARREFNTLRATFQEVNSTIRTKFCLEPEPIDWDRYRKSIGSRLVDMYKEAYEKVEIPKFVDTVTPEYQPKFDALLVKLKELEQDSLKETERLEKEIASFKEEKAKLSSMTADEYFARHPDLKKKFDDEIRNDYWGY